jgi:hypothetical protein
MNIADRAYPLGSWTRGVNSRTEGEPPHYLGRDPRHPNELGVIWADDRHMEPIAVEDWDGCRAPILAKPRSAVPTPLEDDKP